MRPLCIDVEVEQRALDHIRDRHPEMGSNVDKLLATIREPDEVVEERDVAEVEGLVAHVLLKHFEETELGPKYVVAVCRVAGRRGVLVTSYKTSRPEKLRRRGVIIWSRS